MAVEHTKLFEELFASGRRSLGEGAATLKPFDLMKKHFKAYVSGFDGAKELRIKMMEAESAADIEAIVENFLSLRA